MVTVYIVFEQARGLRDSQTSINNKDLGLLVKKEAGNICKDNNWSSFLCVLALYSVFCQPIHLFYAFCGFQKYQKVFNQKIYPREQSDSSKCFCFAMDMKAFILGRVGLHC